MKALTEEQWWSIADHAFQPTGLKYPLPDSFVYDRERGLFQVDYGCHQLVMAMLLSFREDLDDYFHLATKRNIKVQNHMIYDFADEFIQLPGTAFLSSVAKTISVGKLSNLNRLEQKFFTEAGFIFSEVAP